MAPVRQDASHRPGHIQSGIAPPATAPRPAQAPAKGAPTTPDLTVRDGFESAKARPQAARPAAAAAAPRDTFQNAALGPRQQHAYASLPPDQRARFDALMGAAQADPTQKGKAVKQVQSLLGPTGDFKHYDMVDQALRSPGATTGERAEARGDLQQLLFSGRLTAGKGPLQQNAIEHLGVLAAQQRTATGLDAHALLADTVLDLAHPNRIKQGPNNQDCGGTAAAVILSKAKPAEYARIVTDLGTKGSTNVGNQIWTASPLKEKDAPGGRSLSQQLFAATYVKQTNDPTIPPTTDAQVKGLLNGEYGREMAEGLRTLTGRNYQSASVPSVQESNLVTHRAAVSEALTAIAQHLSKGAPIALNVDHHWVVATGSSGPRGASVIQVADGSGQSRGIAVKDLQNRLQGFVFDNAISSVPMDMRLRRYDKPGTGGDASDGTQPTGSRSRL